MSPPKRKAASSARPMDGAAGKNQLEAFTSGTAHGLTTNQGLQIPDNHNSLKAGVRGPTLLEDFILREKLRILTMSAFQSAWCTHVAPARMGTSRCTSRWWNTPAQVFAGPGR